MNRKQIKLEATEALKGNRLMFIVALIIVSALTGTGIGSLIAPILSAGIFLIGKVLLYEKKFDFELILEYFKDLNHAIKLFAVAFLYGIIVSVGLLLFIIPGVYFLLHYSQVLYIMAEDKEIGIWDAFKQSGEMMNGYKWDLFVFYLSFIGHIILGIITFGIYLIYVLPYIELSKINYYLHLKNKDVIVKEVASS